MPTDWDILRAKPHALHTWGARCSVSVCPDDILNHIDVYEYMPHTCNCNCNRQPLRNVRGTYSKFRGNYYGILLCVWRPKRGDQRTAHASLCKVQSARVLSKTRVEHAIAPCAQEQVSPVSGYIAEHALCCSRHNVVRHLDITRKVFFFAAQQQHHFTIRNYKIQVSTKKDFVKIVNTKVTGPKLQPIIQLASPNHCAIVAFALSHVLRRWVRMHAA